MPPPLLALTLVLRALLPQPRALLPARTPTLPLLERTPAKPRLLPLLELPLRAAAGRLLQEPLAPVLLLAQPLLALRWALLDPPLPLGPAPAARRTNGV